MRNRHPGSNLEDLKRSNRFGVLNCIYHQDGISRKEIAAALGLTPATITSITNDMLQAQLLYEKRIEPPQPHVGRREIGLSICTERFCAIGISIERRRIVSAVYDLRQTRIAQQETQLSAAPLTEILQCIQNHAALLQATAAENKQELIGIGIGIRGAVDIQDGISIDSYGIVPRNTNLCAALQQTFGVPVALHNNVCALAHGELFFSARRYPDNVLFIKYGPGIGAAHLLSQAVYGNTNYGQAELGHTIAAAYGKPCVCGNLGCLETVAGFDALEQQFSAKTGYRDADFLTMLASCKNGQTQAQDILRQSVFYFALAIKNSVELLRPNALVLYGAPFADTYYLQLLQQQLQQLHCRVDMKISEYNLRLTTSGPASTAIFRFFQGGGFLHRFS